VIPYETENELRELLCLLRPDIRFLGDDYRGKSFTGDDLEIEIHFCNRLHGVSSSGRRKKIWETETQKVILQQVKSGEIKPGRDEEE
jgi:glycerol-3-phosphate cytidylyltransferase